MDTLIGLLIPAAILIPLVIGGGFFMSPAQPIHRAAGWLTLFPFLNLFVPILGIMITRDLNPSATTQWLSLIVPGILLHIFFMLAFRTDWQARKLRRWLWISLSFTLAHLLLIPMVLVTFFYVLELHSELAQWEIDLAKQSGEPATLLFFMIPILATFFNAWMLRREIG